jgi:hypothetical protein
VRLSHPPYSAVMALAWRFARRLLRTIMDFFLPVVPWASESDCIYTIGFIPCIATPFVGSAFVCHC